MLQTDGWTPLFTASFVGHVECVRALLGGGAAIDQARVGCTSSMARHPGSAVCVGLPGSLLYRALSFGSLWELVCKHAFAAGGVLGWHALEGMGCR